MCVLCVCLKGTERSVHTMVGFVQLEMGRNAEQTQGPAGFVGNAK